MMRSRRGGRRNVDTAELNITAFMNLMVILVPFLLITAVFSRLAILELNLPGSSNEPVDPQEQTFQLEVTVRMGQIEVGDRNLGALGIYPNNSDGYDYDDRLCGCVTCQAPEGFSWRSVIAFRNFTLAISRLSTIWFVFVCNSA